MTPELQQQIDRYQRSGSYSLTEPLKRELATIWKERTGTTLVIACGSCLGKALAYLAAPPAPKIKFKAVKNFETVAEMKQEATRLGLTFPKFATRIYMEKLLNL
jgi:hypothetical protein